MSASSKPVPIALPNALLDKIQKVAGLTGRSQQDIMRLAMEVGLEDLKRINYDLGSAVVDASERTKGIVTVAVIHENAAEYIAPESKSSEGAAAHLEELARKQSVPLKTSPPGRKPKGR